MNNEEVYEKSMAEVLYVLENTEETVTSKIPQYIMERIYNKADKEYMKNMQSEWNKGDIALSERAKAIIAIIYRDYLCNSIEKDEFNKYMSEKFKKIEEEKQEKYPADQIFENKKATTSETQLIKVEEQNIIKKMLNRMKEFFRSKM